MQEALRCSRTRSQVNSTRAEGAPLLVVGREPPIAPDRRCPERGSAGARRSDPPRRSENVTGSRLARRTSLLTLRERRRRRRGRARHGAAADRSASVGAGGNAAHGGDRRVGGAERRLRVASVRARRLPAHWRKQRHRLRVWRRRHPDEVRRRDEAVRLEPGPRPRGERQERPRRCDGARQQKYSLQLDVPQVSAPFEPHRSSPSRRRSTRRTSVEEMRTSRRSQRASTVSQGASSSFFHAKHAFELPRASR